MSQKPKDQDPARVRIPSRPAGGGRLTHLAVRRARTGRRHQLRLRVHRPRRFDPGGGEYGGRALPALAAASTAPLAPAEADTDAHAHTDPYAHAHSYADAHAHSYADAHPDAHTHSDPDAHPDTHTDPDSHP
ncbi:hypothetical protein [Streptomyces liangshanensis]|uniref:hypothetical protein n=1 Tax=Streptomyces liangshanensis TaxID=2717324 RepID=UPI0036DB0AB9